MTDRIKSTKKARAEDLPPGYRYGDAGKAINPPPVHACSFDRWQDVKTAPKDGTRILLFGVQRAFLQRRAFCGCYANDRWMGETGDGGRVTIVTHWMPLPNPPVQEPSDVE